MLVIAYSQGAICNDDAVSGSEALLHPARKIYTLFKQNLRVSAAFLGGLYHFKDVGGIAIGTVLHFLVVPGEIFRRITGVVDIRPARNLAKLTQIIGKFEYLHNVDVLTGKYIIKDTELLFNMYIKLLFDGGIAEYEDDEEYAPTGCVSFLTIHQSKGMEFPIVFVDSLGNVPRKSYKDILNKIEGRYYHRETFEPYDEMKLFDFWRLYYTAFSRAQDLLVLTCNEDKKTPSKYIKEVYGELQSVEALDLSEFTFHTVKSVNLKNTFSFTSHIAVYETCALQYKFYKELEFMPIRQGAMLFGTLVHETIEDVHRAALRHETEKITKTDRNDIYLIYCYLF